jgi:hypothetical protein
LMNFYTALNFLVTFLTSLPFGAGSGWGLEKK